MTKNVGPLVTSSGNTVKINGTCVTGGAGSGPLSSPFLPSPTFRDSLDLRKKVEAVTTLRATKGAEPRDLEGRSGYFTSFRTMTKCLLFSTPVTLLRSTEVPVWTIHRLGPLSRPLD